MIFSKQVEFSLKQAITASALSTKAIDFGERSQQPATGRTESADMGIGGVHPVHVGVTADFAGATSVQVQVQTSDTVDGDGNLNGTVKTVQSSSVVPVAELVAGYQFNIDDIPEGTVGRYMQLNYVVVGSDATAGTITAGVVGGRSAGH